MQKREYNLSRQETNYFCVPAVIQAIMRKYGQELTQTEIAVELNLPPGGLVLLKDCHDFFKKRRLGFKNYYYDEVPDKDQDLLVADAFEKDQDLIVGWNRKGPHVHLALDFLQNNLVMQDPEDLSEFSMNIHELERKMWCEKFGAYGLISKI